MKKIFLFLSTFMLSVLIYGQDSTTTEYKKALESITLAEMKDHIKALASEKFAGRGSGQPGLQLAAEYIRAEFISAGLKGISKTGDPYYQEFNLMRGNKYDLSICSQHDTLSTSNELIYTGAINAITEQTPVVFMGFGIETEIYSDYTPEIDVQDKIVVFFAGEPKDKNGKYPISQSYLPHFTDRGASKAAKAYEKGAACVLRINPDQEAINRRVDMSKRFNDSRMLTLPKNLNHTTDPGMIHAGLDDMSDVLNISVKVLEKKLSKLSLGKPQSAELEVLLQVKTDKSKQFVTVQNLAVAVMGYEKPDEWIIVTAHYDHLGQRKGEIFHGADDNATGTAAVIEIAEAFAGLSKIDKRPKRSILFLPVSAEEIGLLGSKNYVENPIIPLNNTIATVNMDMIGRSDKKHSDNPDYVYVYVSDSTNSSLANLVRSSHQTVNSEVIPEYKYRKDVDYTMGGSDHAPFERKGIPVLYYYCGLHQDYHRSSDTWEKIEYKKFTEITRLAFSSVYKLANQ